ncbi:SAM-dependent methyltransferase [Pseudomonas chlororaphis]|uniref:SAM-dependent methyltransferase n=1 Tax=Pseudomonas chlororaphis TaxID=587753 RepID=UPI001B3166F7|nr:SAM-dependent methyltransferase [Pseudomonas chlororaphis]QTT88295.1 hypothetical protein HUT28_13220 [Pseudomonas chlororaphis]
MSKLFILGTGIYNTLQMSVETLQALKTCEAIYVLHNDKMVIDALGKYTRVIDLYSLYESELQFRKDIYLEISETVTQHALSTETPIGFVVHGNPFFLVSASEYILEQARSKGIESKVLPSISSFDTILCDLEIDLGYGVQLFDPTTMIINNWKPNPKVPLLLFQLATVLNPNVVIDDPRSSTLEPLVDYLLEFYPADHECVLVHSASHLLERSETLGLKLGDLSKNEGIDLWKRPTLYVPARV